MDIAIRVDANKGSRERHIEKPYRELVIIITARRDFSVYIYIYMYVRPICIKVFGPKLYAR